MKTAIKIIICLCVTAGIHAQSGVSTTTVNSKKVLGNNLVLNPAVSKTDLSELKGAKHAKKLNLKSLSKLGISRSDLARKSRRSARITPKKPVHPYLSISYYGEYSKEYFMLNYRPYAADGKSYKYSGFVQYNAVKGKEYRVKIALDLRVKDGAYGSLGNSVSQQGTVMVDLGGTEYQAQVSADQSEINFVFRAQAAGYLTIAISPLQVRGAAKSITIPAGLHPPVPSGPYLAGYSTTGLAIKYIQVDEI